jgi:hypothetical protein
MSNARTLTPLFDGGTHLECPRWHGRCWASDFDRYGVFTYHADGREEQVMEVEAKPSGLGWLPRPANSPTSLRKAQSSPATSSVGSCRPAASGGARFRTAGELGVGAQPYQTQCRELGRLCPLPCRNRP